MHSSNGHTFFTAHVVAGYSSPYQCGSSLSAGGRCSSPWCHSGCPLPGRVAAVFRVAAGCSFHGLKSPPFRRWWFPHSKSPEFAAKPRVLCAAATEATNKEDRTVSAVLAVCSLSVDCLVVRVVPVRSVQSTAPRARSRCSAPNSTTKWFQ